MGPPRPVLRKIPVPTAIKSPPSRRPTELRPAPSSVTSAAEVPAKDGSHKKPGPYCYTKPAVACK
eukprot:10979104-Alexandrium_andersonii.AAC.1